MTSPRTPEAAFALPDERLFKEGFCHALAIELGMVFDRAGKTAEFYYLPNREHERLAEHVLVKSSDGFYDVHFGPQTETDVVARWAEKTAGRIEKVGHPGWIQCPSQSSEHHSYLGLCVKHELLEQARARAKGFIEQNRRAYGLL